MTFATVRISRGVTVIFTHFHPTKWEVETVLEKVQAAVIGAFWLL